MLRGATLLMRAAVLLIGMVVLLFAIFLFFEISRSAAMIAEAAVLHVSPWLGAVNELFIVCLYAAILPFFLALFETWKLLGYIDRKSAFSGLSVRVLRIIKVCAVSICALYMAGVMPLIYCIAELDDAPGLILIGLLIGLAPFVVATFAAILQTLLREAISMKTENDLTI